LKAAEHEIVSLSGSEDSIGGEIRDIIRRLNEGGLGKKILLRFEDK